MASHAPMEPPAATVQIKDGKAEVWACVQSPGGTRGDVAKTLGMKEDDVTVNVTLLGGGFGRKSKCDFALEAAILSKAMGGTPVKVVWTREDDIHHSFYHSVSYQHVTAGLDKNNKVVAWRHRSVSPSLMSNFMPDPKRESTLELGLGLIDTPFNVPNLRLETGEAVAQTRIGWFRSVNNIPHAFAMQSMVAELAAELGQGSEGLPARDDRPAAHRRSAQDRDQPSCGTTAIRGTPIRSIRRVPAASSSAPPRKPAGGVSCPRAMAWASRFNAAS